MSAITRQPMRKLVTCYKGGYEFHVVHAAELSRKLCNDFLREFIYQFDGHNFKPALKKASEIYHITGIISYDCNSDGKKSDHKKTEYKLTIVPLGDDEQHSWATNIANTAFIPCSYKPKLTRNLLIPSQFWF